MKRAFIIGLLGLALAAAAFFICLRTTTHPLRSLAEQPSAEMGWLAREYQLTPEQRADIARLQAGYDPRCMELCRRIEENNRKLDQLITAGNKRTSEVDALLQESAAIQIECRRDMLDHIYRVAGAMSPDQGKRYLDLMKLQVLRPGAIHEFRSRP